MTMNDIGSLLASAVQQNPEILGSILSGLNTQTAAPATAPVAAAPVAAITRTSDGKIDLSGINQPKPREEQTDIRIPETVITIGADGDLTITLGYGKTAKDSKGKTYNPGWGVRVGNSRTTFHRLETWAWYAAIAPLVVKAVAENFKTK